ncbi:unnamed protein product [Scytosiphon promiscuus]
MTEDFFHLFDMRKWDTARSCRRQIFLQCMVAEHARARARQTPPHRVKFSCLVRQRRTLVTVVDEPPSSDLSHDPPCIVEQRCLKDSFKHIASVETCSRAGPVGPPQVLERRLDRAICDAFRDGETHHLRALIRAGASPAFRRKPGESALHAAAFCGDVELVKKLAFALGVQSSRDVSENLPADLAALKEQWQVLRMLQREPAHRSDKSSTVKAFDKHVP